jgi:mRNA-degrading endonuclease RelE of RelBE toxin-antitoxin system
MLFQNRKIIVSNHHVVPEQKKHSIKPSGCSGIKESQYRIIMLFRNKTITVSNRIAMLFWNKRITVSNHHVVPEQNVSNHHVVPEQKKHSIKSSCCSGTKQSQYRIAMFRNENKRIKKSSYFSGTKTSRTKTSQYRIAMFWNKTNVSTNRHVVSE